jgi:hypothetical protein
LPVDIESHARAHGALQRARKLVSAAQLLRLVLGYCGLDWTLREAAGQFTLLGQRLSDMAVRYRLCTALPWIQALLAQLMSTWLPAATPGYLRFVVIDGTTVQGPGAKGTWYRLHVALDLIRLRLLHVELTDAYRGEGWDYYPLQEGDVVLVDRAYNQPRQLIEQADRGVSVVVRYNPHGMRVYEDAGTAIDVARWLREHDATSAWRAVCISAGGAYIEATLHAWRLPPPAAAEARRRVRERARNKGRTPRAATLALAEWVLVLSTLPATLLPTDTIMMLYRARWQAELAMKRLKSLLDIDRLRARQGSPLAELYLHGKLLYAWLLEQRAQRRRPWERLDQPRSATPWRVYQLVHRELSTVIAGVAHWCLSRWDEVMAVMRERPRRRRLQQLPSRVTDLIRFCQAHGISNI